MPLGSLESLLDGLLPPEERGTENVDFVLQKRRIEEVFTELANDLETFGRIEGFLRKQADGGARQWAKFEDALENRTNYEAFRILLLEFQERTVKHAPGEHSESLFLREVIQKVRAIGEKSLLRPPSPPVVIRNRAEHETIRWKRMIVLQESEVESLKRKIADCERKLVERQNQRRELQLRSKREKDEQVNASHTALVEIKLEGDQTVQRLQEEISRLPQHESTAEYFASMDQREEKRKRIAKLQVQLQLWIKKYDKFIGEPMPSLLELEERMAGFEEWKENVFKPQVERLNQMREEIRVLEAIALEEKVEEIRKMHAVRVLQRAWKRTLAVKRSKKSKKPNKGKGKVKKRK